MFKNIQICELHLGLKTKFRHLSLIQLLLIDVTVNVTLNAQLRKGFELPQPKL